MKNVKYLLKDDLLKSGSLIFYSVMFAGGINLFYSIFMARIFDVATYGEFGALFALSFFLSFILIKTLRLINTKFISTLKGQKKLHLIPVYHSKIMIRMTIIGIIAFLIFVLLRGFIADFLHINDMVLIIFIGIVFLLSWILPINLGVMQGLQRFNHLGFNNIVRASSKFIFGVGFVMLGFGIYGAVGGMILGIFIALIASFFSLRDYIKLPGSKESSNRSKSTIGKSHETDRNLNLELGEVYKYSFYVLLAIACIHIPTNVDVMLAKHFFTSEETGLYVSASVFGRIMFFLPMSINTVMYPKVVEANARHRNTLNILRKSLIYTAIPVGAIVLAYRLLPKIFLGILGNKYFEAEPFLNIYGPLMFFFSLTIVLVYYNLAKDRYGFIYFFTIFSVVEVGLIYIFHTSLINMLQIFLVMNIILFAASLIISYYYPGSRRDKKIASPKA